jgi:transposase-like protein
MSNSQPTLISAIFVDEEAARLYVERLRWGENPVCPTCQTSNKQYRQNRKEAMGYFICGACGKTYTVRVSTLFQHSRVPLRKWLHAIHLVHAAGGGCVSSTHLSKKIGVSQKTSWSMLQRIQRALDDRHAKGFLERLLENLGNLCHSSVPVMD